MNDDENGTAATENCTPPVDTVVPPAAVAEDTMAMPANNAESEPPVKEDIPEP
ncbi:hypothetical protein GGF44_003246, partial [Coemansia sp. RSA 1694]